MTRPLRSLEEAMRLVSEEMGEEVTLDWEDWEDDDEFEDYVELDPDYDPAEDPEFVDEDDATKNVLRQIYNYKGVSQQPKQLPLEVPFVTAELGPPNPWFDKMGVFIDSSEELREIAKEVKEIGEKHLKPNGILGDEYDIASIMKEVAHLRPRFEAIIRKVEETPLTPGVMPSKPDPKELYKRVLPHSRVYDVGAGTAVKVIEALKPFDCEVRGCDPNSIAASIDKVSYQQAEEEQKIPEDSVVTSFMSVTQITEKEEEMLEERDGIHIFPDVEQLVKLNVAVPTEKGARVAGTDGKIWNDRRSKLEACSPDKPGYQNATTYKKEEIILDFGEEEEGGKPFATMSKPGFDRSSDSGFKWDGEMVMIEVDKGRARMKKRNGKFRKGVTDSKSRFSILAEEMKNAGGEVVAYILIRVKLYNNFIPFHNGPSLRLFCRKKNVKINGIPLCGPLVYDPVKVFENERGTFVNFKTGNGSVYQLPVDGFILRGERQDLYNKFTWTVDMNYDPEMEERLFDHFDRKTTILKPPCGGLWEFRVEVSDNAISLVPTRERTDKIHENTLDQVKETIAYALEQF